MVQQTDGQMDGHVGEWLGPGEEWEAEVVGPLRSRDSAVLTPLLSATDETSFEAGIKVQIHSQDEPPLIDQLGFGVAPGFQTFVSCQEQRVGTGQVWGVPSNPALREQSLLAVPLSPHWMERRTWSWGTVP